MFEGTIELRKNKSFSWQLLLYYVPTGGNLARRNAFHLQEIVIFAEVVRNHQLISSCFVILLERFCGKCLVG